MLLHDESPAAVEARDSRYILGTYARTSFHPRGGNGAQVVDAAGTVHWDLLSGIAVNALGYAHPALVRVLQEEAEGLLHTSNLYFHPAQGLLAKKLVELSQLDKVFFCNSGTEANEAALKIARLANPGRSEIIALEEGFHGRTFGALSVTGHAPYRTPFEPLLPSVRFIAPNDIDALEAAVTRDTSAIVLEPIMGEAGVIPLSFEFLRAASRLANEHGAVLICDEIQCGLGRAGAMFAFQQAAIVPDIVTLAKPLGGGLPLGAVLVGSHLAKAVKPGMHGTTFGGNPIACRLGLAMLDEIEASKLVEKNAALGEWFGKELAALAARNQAIADVRGRGLMWGVELSIAAKPVANALLQRRFIVGTARENVLRLLPPYVVPQEALVEFIAALDQVVEQATEGVRERVA